MILNFYISDILNFFIIIMFLTISLNHFLVYLGRRKIIKEKYNYYFSFFSFNLSIFLLLRTKFIKEVFINNDFLNYLWEPTFILFVIIFTYFGINLINNLINYPYTKKTNSAWLMLWIVFLLLLSKKFISQQIFENIIIKTAIVIINIILIYLLSLHTRWIIKNKLYKNKEIRLIIFLFFLLTIIIPLKILLINFKIIFTEVFFELIFVILGFSYILTRKFNQEFINMINLQNTFEAKVFERTKELEEANKQKTDFFINLAHEIKTPLTLIGNHLDKISSQIYITVDKNIKNNLDIIIESYGKLEKDIVNFLDVEKLAKGKILFNEISTIDLKTFIGKKIELFRENAQKNNIKITQILDESYIDIDPKAMDCILNNILDNAIKYNKEKGNIYISLKEEKNKVILKIKDTGIGIDNKHIKHIFEKYYQISHKKRNIQGLGMGLSIVKSIVEQSKGEIKVESQKDKGSIFTVIFTASKKDAVKNKEEIISTDKPLKTVKIELMEENYEEKIPTIFLVEDNEKTIMMLQRDLYKLYNVYYAKNGKEALDKIKKIPKPDIIISDIMMDEMDGIIFCNKIKKISRYKDIPFIFLTAKTREEDRIEGYLEGAVDYILKPFSIGELYLKMENIINQSRESKDKIIKKIAEDKKEKLNNNYLKYKITDKQIKIINMLKKGKQNKEIAYELGITEGTVKNQLGKIFLKTKIKTRTELMKLFL